MYWDKWGAIGGGGRTKMVMTTEANAKAEVKVEDQKGSPRATMAEGRRRDVAYPPR